jgi:CRP/FNR family cyclic AMP-dependent transcriptional regulator
MAGRVLKALRQDGLIEVAGKTIVVLREPKEPLPSEVREDARPETDHDTPAG